MARRALTWGLTLPLVGASVLAGHALAYAATGVDVGPIHAYLGHAPQILAILGLLGLVGLAVDARSEQVGTLPFAGLGVAVFAVQEHLERFAHSGDVPLLITDRTFLLGAALQVPVGLLAVWIARRLVVTLRTLAARPSRPPLLWQLPVGIGYLVSGVPRQRPPVATLGRGPPRLLRP